MKKQRAHTSDGKTTRVFQSIGGALDAAKQAAKSLGRKVAVSVTTTPGEELPATRTELLERSSAFREYEALSTLAFAADCYCFEVTGERGTDWQQLTFNIYMEGPKDGETWENVPVTFSATLHVEKAGRFWTLLSQNNEKALGTFDSFYDMHAKLSEELQPFVDAYRERSTALPDDDFSEFDK